MKVLTYQGLQLYHDLATEKFADAQTTAESIEALNERINSGGNSTPMTDEIIESIIGRTIGYAEGQIV